MKHSQTGIARKIFFLLIGLLFTFGVNAQTIAVSGTVTDPTGEPLIGASILAQGTSTGTSTDIDGHYTINVASNATLVFSYVGYDPQTVAVNGQTTINVTMKENSVMLNEVVAIGYGTVKKSDATGSVAVIKPDEVEAGLATSVQDMLVGQTPGVVVTQSGGPEGAANKHPHPRWFLTERQQRPPHRARRCAPVGQQRSGYVEPPGNDLAREHREHDRPQGRIRHRHLRCTRI